MPECYGDTLWVRFIYGKSVRHINGSEVANAMQKFHNRIAIGIIDNDKRKPNYFKDFKTINQSEGIQLMRKPETEHYVITVNPAIEKWLLDRADESGLNHGYSLTTLKKAMKCEDVERDQKLKGFLNSLKQKNIKGVVDFRRWLVDLMS